LGDDDILNFIEEEIDRSGVPSTSICFEVTESAAVSSHNKAQTFIDALRKRGCKFSLDDFGAGLSSFAYLKKFKVGTLKIDGGFIRDISANQISKSMVVAITQVARVMNLSTVAEYVETENTKNLLAKIGVDFAQGTPLVSPRHLRTFSLRSAATRSLRLLNSAIRRPPECVWHGGWSRQSSLC
jgi:EAL domain-containing protein (putative c-di-GMP-specific phosphodiesterase class I)